MSVCGRTQPSHALLSPAALALGMRGLLALSLIKRIYTFKETKTRPVWGRWGRSSHTLYKRRPIRWEQVTPRPLQALRSRDPHETAHRHLRLFHQTHGDSNRAHVPPSPTHAGMVHSDRVNEDAAKPQVAGF